MEESNSYINMEQCNSCINMEQCNSCINMEQCNSYITMEESNSYINMEQCNSCINMEQCNSCINMEQCNSYINMEQCNSYINDTSFSGNSNADSVVQHTLQQPVLARYLRLVPLEWNPSGRIGLRLETYGSERASSPSLFCAVVSASDVVGFDGSSGLSYHWSPGPRQRAKESISLKFKTLKNSGTLLHAQGPEERSLTLELKRGKLRLLLRQGSNLNDGQWHTVILSSSPGRLTISVDQEDGDTAQAWPSFYRKSPLIGG
ncbi:hypothetical protein NHX12_003737 [Muraenolepis orangiensis]|uniref:Laminin G domain-containing protein n=1 Tax=Muraenolepis orangiensis TaxID=630683 RepID=A0A9Q0IDK0_9TELE|nr:hypothetical protein NHX12_003737 [Muraenolepis orangiensis]